MNIRFDKIKNRRKSLPPWLEKEPDPNLRKMGDLPAVIQNHYRSAYESVQLGEIKPELPELRASSLPYCPILNAKAAIDDESLSEWSKGLNDSFYLEIGTAVHAAWQAGMANGEQGRFLYGNWKCEGCEAVRTNTLRPDICNCGYQPWTYVELEFKWRGLSGHCDAVTMYPGYGNVIHDLKTSSLTQTEPNSDAIYLPQAKHIHQIETYVVLMWILYKICINYYCVYYISREKVDPTYTRIYGPIKFTKQMYNKRLLLMQRATLSNKSLIKFMDKPTPALADIMIDNRPCHTMKEVEAFEATQFKWTCNNREICSLGDEARIPLIGQLREAQSTWQLYQER